MLIRDGGRNSFRCSAGKGKQNNRETHRLCLKTAFLGIGDKRLCPMFTRFWNISTKLCCIGGRCAASSWQAQDERLSTTRGWIVFTFKCLTIINVSKSSVQINQTVLPWRPAILFFIPGEYYPASSANNRGVCCYCPLRRFKSTQHIFLPTSAF